MRQSGQFLFPLMDRVLFGRPAAEAVLDEADRLGARHVLLVASRTLNTTTDAITRIAAVLGPRCVGVYDSVPQHTTRAAVVEAARIGIDRQVDLVVAIGGGSVVDAAKMVLMCIEHGVTEASGLDPFVVTAGPDGRPRPSAFREPRARLIVAPSTLSGGEYNAGCLVTDEARKVKHTFFHRGMMPRAIILDPDLAAHTPMLLWLGSGTRAMDHGIEAISSTAGNPLADAAIARGLRLLRDGLPRTRDDFEDLEARRMCQYGSWLSAFGLQAMVPMGASHAIGHVLGGTCDVPHYFCTPVMMPSVLRYNAPAAREAQAAIAEALRAPDQAAADAFERFVQDLGLPTRLSAVGVTPARFREIGEITMKEEIFAHTNPRPLRGPEDVIEILNLAA